MPDDDDISLDLSGIKKFFKKKPKKEEDHKEEKSEKDDEELNVDLSGMKRFANRHSKTLLTILLILIPVVLSIVIRTGNVNVPITDDWARTTVQNYYQNQIKATIDQQYPNLPDANKQALIDSQYASFAAQQKSQIEQQIKQTSDYFKNGYRDEDGHIFIPDIDPYYWYRHAKNIVDHGNPGDIIKNGVPWDNHMLAPIGRAVPPDMFHSYFLAWEYPIIKVFAPSDTLLDSIAYYPLIVSALTAIFVFLIGRKIGGNIAGLFAACFAAVNVAVVNRTIFGHADSDAWVVFFGVVITWLFLEAMDAKKLWARLSLATLAGVLIGIYSWAWSGWWYILTFITLAATGYIGIYVILHRKDIFRRKTALFHAPAIRNTLLILLVVYVFSAIVVTMVDNFDAFLMFPGLIFSTAAIKAPVQAHTLWPNVLTTVAELNPGSVGSVIDQMGGKIIYILGLLGIVITLIPKKGSGWLKWGYIIASAIWFLVMSTSAMQQLSTMTYLILLSLPLVVGIALILHAGDMTTEPQYAILLMVWFISTIYATIKGIRFTLLLVPAFALAFGIFIGWAINSFTPWLSKELKVKRAIMVVLLVAMFGLLFIGPIRASAQTTRQDVPIVNTAWYSALNAIKDNSQKDAIINSWWDFGHHFKAIADRAVTFDGTTQHHPQAHWIGKVLLTDDELQAKGILRMLDCGGETAFDALYTQTGDFHGSINSLYAIFKLDREQARAYLTTRYDAALAEKVLPLTHCDPPEDFFIASDDMIGKSGVWAHFGSWNFTKADIYQNTRSMTSDEAVTYIIGKFNISADEARQLHFEAQGLAGDKEGNDWIAPWPSYVTGVQACTVKVSIADCGNGFTVDLSTMEPTIQTPQGERKPVAFGYADKDGVHKKSYVTDFPYGVDLVPQGDNYYAIFMSPELTTSMFSIMYFYRGHGLQYFDPFIATQHFTGTRVNVYKVDWSGTNKTVIDEFIEKTSAQNGDSVSLQYIGYTDDGVFDSSITGWPSLGITPQSDLADYNNTPLSFTLGANQVIAGFENGVLGMAPGQLKTIDVPSGEGYTTGVLANKTLHFKVKVLRIH